MTVLYQCDGPGPCPAQLSEVATRISLTVDNAPMPPMPELGEGEQIHLLAELKFGWTGDHHFCSAGCLAAWAMDRAITDAEGTT